MPWQPPATDEVIDLQGGGASAPPAWQPPDTDEVVGPAPSERPSFAGGVTRAAAQGATFGFSDEGEAVARALADRDEGEDFMDAYRRHRDSIRGGMEQFKQQNPGTAFTAEMAGGLAVPGLGAAKLAAGAVRGGVGLGGMMARGAATGAGLGGAYGAGTAQEMSDVPRETAIGAVTGAGIGGALPPLAAGARSIARTIRGSVAPSLGADRRIAQAMARDKMTPEEVQRRLKQAQALGRPATIADVGGTSIKRELETAAQSPGPGAGIAEEFLTIRNKGQFTRLSHDLVRTTGVPATNVEAAIANTIKARAAAAEPLYQKAMEFPAELSDDLVQTFNAATKTPIGRRALARGARILNAPKWDEAPLMERINAWKQGVDDFITEARRKGTFNEARKAQEMKDGVIDLVDAVNPEYRLARQTWETDSKYLDALNEGRGILNPKVTSTQLKMELAKMTDADKEAYRIGAVDAIVTRMRQDAAQEPNLLKYLRAPERMDKITAMMEPEVATRFRKIVDVEDKMFATASQALKGSATARRTASMQEQEKELRAVEAVQTLVNLVYSPLRSLIIQKIPGVSAAVRERLLARQNEVIASRLLGGQASKLPQPLPPGGAAGQRAAVPFIGAAEQAEQAYFGPR